MGNRAIENRIKKLQEMEAQQKALEQEAEKLKEEIKKEMEVGNLFTAGRESLKAAFPEIYSQYCRVSASRRFTVA